MIVHGQGITTIQCDKCKKISSSSSANYNIKFALEEWSLNSKGRKYKHICYDCLTEKQKKAKDFVNKKFGFKI